MLDCSKEERSRHNSGFVTLRTFRDRWERRVRGGSFWRGAGAESRSRPQAILPSLHWNKDKDGKKTIQFRPLRGSRQNSEGWFDGVCTGMYYSEFASGQRRKSAPSDEGPLSPT